MSMPGVFSTAGDTMSVGEHKYTGGMFSTLTIKDLIY